MPRLDLPPAPLDRPQRLAIMVILDRRGRIVFSDLARALGISKGALDHHLRTLESSGYVAREQAFLDSAPRVQVTATFKGLDALREAKRLWLAIFS